MDSPRILIVDDEPPARARLRALIDAGGLGSVIGEAADGIQTLELAAELHPDIVLLDVRMPGMNGLDGLRQLMALAAGVPVAIITGNPTRPLMNDVLEAGAAGIVSKSSPAKSLANSIRFIHSGETYMPLHLTREDHKKHQGNTGPLSSREMTVLSYLGEGKKNKQIASSLGLSEGTVKMHVMSICKKLEATNRTHAVINARNTGLL